MQEAGETGTLTITILALTAPLDPAAATLTVTLTPNGSNSPFVTFLSSLTVMVPAPTPSSPSNATFQVHVSSAVRNIPQLSVTITVSGASLCTSPLVAGVAFWVNEQDLLAASASDFFNTDSSPLVWTRGGTDSPNVAWPYGPADSSYVHSGYVAMLPVHLGFI